MFYVCVQQLPEQEAVSTAWREAASSPPVPPLRRLPSQTNLRQRLLCQPGGQRRWDPALLRLLYFHLLLLLTQTQEGRGQDVVTHKKWQRKSFWMWHSHGIPFHQHTGLPVRSLPRCFSPYTVPNISPANNLPFLMDIHCSLWLGGLNKWVYLIIIACITHFKLVCSSLNDDGCVLRESDSDSCFNSAGDDPIDMNNNSI